MSCIRLVSYGMVCTSGSEKKKKKKEGAGHGTLPHSVICLTQLALEEWKSHACAELASIPGPHRHRIYDRREEFFPTVVDPVAMRAWDRG